jgi:hypothetical protein
MNPPVAMFPPAVGYEPVYLHRTARIDSAKRRPSPSEFDADHLPCLTATGADVRPSFKPPSSTTVPITFSIELVQPAPELRW